MKTFVLDTNVLLYDPHCLSVFENNEIVIPLAVLDELDNAKTRFDDVGRNARQIIRTLDGFRGLGSLSEGVQYRSCIIRVDTNCANLVPEGLPAEKADNRIISAALGLKQSGKSERVIVVSKDINLRVKCDVLGLEAEDYEKDKITQDMESIYGGVKTLVISSAKINELYEEGTVELEGIKAYPNQFFILKSEESESHSGITRFIDGQFRMCRFPKELWGIKPRNAEQKMAMELLLDSNVKLVTMIGKAGSGKAQPLDADILTPNGYIKMGDVQIGNDVLAPDGKITKISGIFPQGEIDIYRVYFSDGTFTECSEDHLWHTRTQLDRDQKKSGSAKTLKEIMNSLRYGQKNSKNHSVPMVKHLDFVPNKICKIDPYVLGLLIGDGCFRGGSPSFSTEDPQLLENIDKLLPECRISKKSGNNCDYYLFDKTGRTLKQPICAQNENSTHIFYSWKQIKDAGFLHHRNIYKAMKLKNKYRGLYWSFSDTNNINSINQLKYFLCELELYNKKSDEKFIPTEYKINSFKNRLALLQGLMDTDGSISANGMTIEFSSTSLRLAEDVKFLVESLGGKAVLTSRQTKYAYKNVKKTGKVSHRVFISVPSDVNVFRLSRKVEKIKPRTKYIPTRYIDKVEYVGKKQAQCIYVEHPEHLYITNNFIVTHNTLIACASALHHVINENKIYNRILVARPIQPMGKDIGFLPGDIQEKLAPWMQPVYDNLELLLGSDYQMINLYREQGILNVEALTYIRGRSIPNSLILIDEAQNLTAHEIKTIITRIGENSKIIFTGDINQIDQPYLDFADNGLTHVVEKFKEYPIAGHITLRKGERSPLATLASEIL